MSPALREGDFVFVDRKVVAGNIAVGDIVLARHPYKTGLTLVKRIGGVTAEGLYYLVGDNAAESSDSGSFGAIPLSSIEGKVACVIPVNP